MDREQVKAALDAKRKSGALLARLGGIQQVASLFTGRAIPPTLRSVLEQAAGAPDHSRQLVLAKGRAALADQLGSVADDDWGRIADRLLPHIAPSVTSALHALARRPYMEGMARKPFRAPNAKQALSAVRARWLVNIALLLGDYDADLVWVAEHAAVLGGWTGILDMGWLLAGAIDVGDESASRVFDILASTVRGERENAQMGRHVVQALLSCGRPDAWELVQKLLLAAQREEGTRQSILESVDEAHPQAFRAMLRVIREHGLSRFSSVVRAADTWFGFQWDGSSAVKVDSLIDRTLTYLDEARARASALEADDAESTYLALWSAAFDDVDVAIPDAIKLLSAAAVETRFVATHFLAQTRWTSASRALVGALGDADLRVAARALDIFGADLTKLVDGAQLFDRLEKLIGRIPSRGQPLDALVWPWWKRTLERSHVAMAMVANGSAVAGERLLPYIPDLEPPARAEFIRRAAGISRRALVLAQDDREGRKLTPGERAVALDLLGDPSPIARSAAFDAMETIPLESDEVDRLVDLLDRKAGDLRSRALGRLRALTDSELLAAADRLLADSGESRRQAGLELLRDAMERGRASSEVRRRIEKFRTERESLSVQEQAHVAAVLQGETDVPTTDNALGLIDPSKLKRWPAPRRLTATLDTPGARASIQSLAELVLVHAETEVRKSNGEVAMLAESVGWGFAPRRREDVEEGGTGIPLRDTWRSWLASRSANLRDPDDLELLRSLVPDDDSHVWKSAPVEKLRGAAPHNSVHRLLHGLVEWCVAWEPPPNGYQFLLDGVEASIAAFDDSDYREINREQSAGSIFTMQFGAKERPHRRKLRSTQLWLGRARWWRNLFPKSIQPAQAERLFGLLRTFESRTGGLHLIRVTLGDFMEAYRAGAVGVDEFIDLAIGRWSGDPHSDLLRQVSLRRPARAFADHPELVEAVDRVRRRIVEVESARGDRPSAASRQTLMLRWTGGLDTLTHALPALGKSHFARNFGWLRNGESRQETLSHLVVRSFPRDEDTPDAFAMWVKSARISQARLVELAVYAPQWAAYVNRVLDWPGLEDAVWWIEAHTKDGRSWQLRDLREEWAASMSERTPLSAEDLAEGAVDVAWFAKTYDALGPERWKSLEAAAKYASSSAGHTRARLFARAMSNTVTRDEILGRIDSSRHQDSVRALGLLPLATGKAGETDLLERYVRLDAFRRQARQFGSARQQSERRAVTIGLANLARTAGFRDPQRLQWAMEQRAVADLVEGPIVVTRADVTLTLAIDSDGVPSLAVTRNGKPLKAFPASLKKDDDAQELKDRLAELKRQRARVRESLEEAMCRGDHFTSSELRTLLEHPILAPSVARLVFVGEDFAGYPTEQGKVLVDHAGKRHVLGSAEEVRVAHPQDLFGRGDWSSWQRECFAAERVQPFKQVFRELYPITDTERGTERSRRYAGHQVNPRQGLALLGGRGWVAKPEEGVSRTFHDEGLTVRLGFQEPFFTPAEVEGLTLEEAIFTKKGDWKPMRLDDVPPRVFSETMRDLDLVVSVAHRGGVDPEATASTVQMRAALVQETAQLLKLGNVELKDHHVIVRGDLATYSIHLGSAGVMVVPSTSIPIVAVHSQHRGRLFLPFADDDPKTAEVMSKVLMLSRDKSIKDPNILQWIRAATLA